MPTEKKARVRILPLPVVLTFGLFLIRGPLLSQQERVPSEVRIIAHHQQKENDRIIATGNVEVHYMNIKLFADRIELDTETKDVYAEGNVSIHFPEEVINCARIHFNLDSSQGEFEEVYGRIQPTVFYEADSIERKDANLYNLRKAKITSCTQSVPRWKFSCTEANFKRNDYIEMWNSVLSIKKIPLFYLPYMRYPLDRERATGFLMPQLGYSGPKGLFYSQGFYLALKRNMDATLNFDYYSERGVGGALEYRYLFSSGTGGDMKFYYFKFKQDPEEDNLSNAYIFRFNHNQPLPFDLTLIGNVDYQSSYDFLREFDNNFKRAVVANRTSTIHLSRVWSFFYLGALVSRFETYFAEIEHSVIKHNLPAVALSASQIKIFSPLYFSFSSRFDRWEYGWEWDYKQGTQLKSQNLSFNSALTFPFTQIPWLTLNSSFYANFNYYFQSYAPGSRVIVDDPLLSSKYTFNTELLGPVFNRIYFGAQGTPKLKHIIEPSVVYRYESPYASSERIITPSGYVFRLHQLTYSLTNRFLIKQNDMTREVFTLGLAQTFYLVPEESPLSRYRIDGKIPRFSDVIGYMRFYPSRKYSLDFSSSFNTYYKTFPSLRVGLNLGTMGDLLFCSINWYKSTNPYYKDILYDRHQISFFGGVKIPKLDLEAQAAFDFNIQERKMLYTLFSFIYHYQCLDFKADLKIFYFREKPETQFRVSFGLGNIGKTTDLLGGY